ncbi:MAG: hypothetical protein J2P45_28730 [Candidatus Dormibacteraeota bacterium]|nr:hypothetical protein [Candidatus Dormibacteraeota bacterium]
MRPPTNDPCYLLELGAREHAAGRREAAYAAWRLAIATAHPDVGPRAACFLALAYQLESRLEEAREAWQVAAEGPNERYQVIACLGLASIADRQGHLGQAIRHWRRATAIAFSTAGRTW